MAEGSVYEARINYTYAGVDMVNVFHYEQLSGAGNALELADEIYDDLIGPMRNIQHPGVIYGLIEVINLDSLTDFALSAEAAGETGNQTAQAAPTFETVTYILTRTTRETRNGRKAFGGLPDTISDINTVDSTFASQAENLRLALETNLGNLDGDEWRLVILGLPNASRPTRVLNPVSSVQQPYISTQNSRKP